MSALSEAHPMRILFVLLILSVLGACASGAKTNKDSAVDNHPALTHQLSWTHTHEIRFGDSSKVTGYLVEFLKAPDGLKLDRDFPSGTVLLQDLDFTTIGMITPGREGVSFNNDGNPSSLGHGGRDQLVMAIFGRTERPQFTSIIPGLDEHARRRGEPAGL
jgi:outer membrane lipoprotein-sorting protein